MTNRRTVMMFPNLALKGGPTQVDGPALFAHAQCLLHRKAGDPCLSEILISLRRTCVSLGNFWYSLSLFLLFKHVFKFSPQHPSGSEWIMGMFLSRSANSFSSQADNTATYNVDTQVLAFGLETRPLLKLSSSCMGHKHVSHLPEQSWVCFESGRSSNTRFLNLTNMIEMKNAAALPGRRVAWFSTWNTFLW